MDRLAESSEGYAVALLSRKWDWLWESLSFCADPHSWPPMDISGWWHWPSSAEAKESGGSQSANRFGEAMYFPNSVGIDPSSGWIFNDTEDADAAGTERGFLSWTLAVAFDHRGVLSGPKRVLHGFTSFFNYNFLLEYNTNTRAVTWTTSHGVLVAPQPDAVDPFDTHRIVITTRWPNETKIYYDGFLVASAAFGSILAQLRSLYLGCDFNQKSNVCLQGTISPVLYARALWSEEQACLWSDDPWGFRRADMHPYVAPPFALPPPRFTCAVGDRDLPAETGDRDLPVETADRNLPAETADRDLPAETADRDLPAEAEGRDLPAETGGRDLPAEAEGRDLPAETGDRTVPSPDESGDRETDVEDHEAPRTTDVDEQTC